MVPGVSERRYQGAMKACGPPPWRAFNGDGSWTCVIETEQVNGRDRPFDHHDTNTLKLVGAPAPNPLAVILKDRAEKK